MAYPQPPFTLSRINLFLLLSMKGFSIKAHSRQHFVLVSLLHTLLDKASLTNVSVLVITKEDMQTSCFTVGMEEQECDSPISAQIIVPHGASGSPVLKAAGPFSHLLDFLNTRLLINNSNHKCQGQCT